MSWVEAICWAIGGGAIGHVLGWRSERGLWSENVQRLIEQSFADRRLVWRLLGRVNRLQRYILASRNRELLPTRKKDWRRYGEVKKP